MLISNDKKIMGDYINGKLARTLGWATTALMTAAAVILFAFAHGAASTDRLRELELLIAKPALNAQEQRVSTRAIYTRRQGREAAAR